MLSFLIHMAEHIYSTKEIAALLKKLNACYRVPVQWSCRRAVQDHTDLFDKKICKGERYYRLSMGDSRGNDAKLAHESMQQFLFLLFAPKPYWEQEIDEIINDRFEQVRRIMDNLRPL